jgi:DNA-binding NarL/FixJ family response regulator
MDLRLRAAGGIDALVAIRGEFPQARRVILLTTSKGDAEIQRPLRSGAGLPAAPTTVRRLHVS